MADNVFSKGKFLYIEPTNPFLNLPDNAVTYPYEDYSMGVNLEVTISDRFSCGQQGAKQITFSTDKGTISFFGGSGTNPEEEKQGYLSTNFTEISPANVGRGNKETLGIESINISYQQWFYPVVNIRFVDVRGTSLFMAQEKGLRDTIARENTDISQLDSGSFFKAIFACPSPVFKLTVKGFYGEPVSYNLRMSSFKADFDSNTGNIIASVDFIGNMYGVYTEIPLIYAAIAPYIDKDNTHLSNDVDYGEVEPGQYWLDNRERFVFSNGAPIPTFDEFYRKLRILKTDENDRVGKYGEEIRKAKNRIGEAQAVISIVNDLIKKYPFNNLREVVEDGTKYKYYFGDSSDLYQNNKNVSYSNVVSFYNSVKEFVEKNSDITNNVGSYIPKNYEDNDCFCEYVITEDNITKYKSEYNSVPGFVKVNENKVSTIDDRPVVKTDTIKLIEDIKKETIKDGKTHYLHLMDTTILKKLNDIVKENTTVQENEQKRLKELNYQTTNEILGFDLTIRNVFKMLFAHLETFIYHYYTALDKVNNNLISSGRTFNDYPFNNWKDSDVNVQVNVPPYPLCIKRDEETNNDVAAWPEETTTSTVMPETKLVVDMINAANMYSNKVKDIKNEEKKKKEAEENSTKEVNEREDFVPLTLFDMINYQTCANPYKNIVDLNKEPKTTAQLIAAVFVLRCYYALYTYYKNSGKNFLGLISYIETLNIYRAFGDMDNTILNNLNSALIDEITIPNIDNPWDINGTAIINKEGIYTFLNGNLFPKIFKFDTIKDSFNNNKKENFIFFDGEKADDFIINNDKNFYNKIKNYIIGAPVPSKEEGFEKEIKILKKEVEDIFNYLCDDKSEISEYNTTYKFSIETGNSGNTGLISLDDIDDETFFCGKDNKPIFGVIEGNGKRFGVFKENSTYKKQDNLLSKAYLFLFSLPLESYSESDIRAYQSSSGVDLKVALLREGAYYWRESFNGEPINGNYDGFTNDKTKVPIVKVNDFLGLTENKKSVYLSWEKIQGKRFIENISNARKESLINFFKTFAEGLFKDFAVLENEVNDIKYNSLQHVFSKFLGERVSFTDLSKPIKATVKTKGNIDIYKNIFNKIIDNLKSIHNFNLKENEGNENDTPTTEPIDTGIFNSKDVYLSTYLLLKDMYDKFFANLNKEMFLIRKEGEPINNDNEFDKFLFVDSYYNDIGDKLLVNGQYLCDLIQDTVFNSAAAEDVPRKLDSNNSVFEFMSQICEKNNLTFLALPQKFGLSVNENGYKEIENMFKPQPFNSNIFDDNRINGSYIALYPYKPSERLDIRDDTGSYAYKQDSFDLWDDEQLPVSLATLTDEAIPAFAVSFAKQNQGLFKNISLTTGNQQITEHSIVAQMDIAARGSMGPGESTLYGQDLYRVYSNYSYQCSVEMMGNLQIMPLMYFQLNNIPMWHGAYMIISVEHNIVAGNITTKFTGVRVNKNAMPFVNNNFIYVENGEVNTFTDDENAAEEKDNIHEEGSNSEGWNTPQGENSPEETEPKGGFDESDDKVEETRTPRKKADRKRAVTEAMKSIFMSNCNKKSTDALCARWTYNLAQSFAKNMENLSLNKCHTIINAGANAYDDELINKVASLGYTVVSEFGNLTGSEVRDKIQKVFKYDYGDVLIYKGGPNGVGKNGKYHAQFCVKDAYRKDAEGYSSNVEDRNGSYENNSGWACDLIDNYHSSFVYNKYISNNWKWKVTLLRYYDNELDRRADEENMKDTADMQNSDLSARKQKIINFLMEHEGSKYTETKNDRGGCTKWGVTIGTFQNYFGSNKTCQDVANMTKEEFSQVVDGFYNRINGDSINNDSICHLVFDMFWMSGPTAIKKIQELFGLKSDGIMGSQTLNALNNGSPKDIFKKIWNMRYEWLKNIAKTPSQSGFLDGWLKRLRAIVFGG